MIRSYFKTIAFLFPLLSNMIFFAMENDQEKVSGIEIQTLSILPDDLLKKEIIRYTAEDKNFKIMCRYFYILAQNYQSSQKKLCLNPNYSTQPRFMPENIEKLYDQVAKKKHHFTKELIFCYYVLTNDHDNTNWMSKFKLKNQFLIYIHNTKEEIKISPAKVLENAQKTIGSNLKDVIIPTNKTYTITDNPPFLSNEQNYNLFLPCLINTCLDQASNLRQLDFETNTINQNTITVGLNSINIRYLLYACINYCSIKCFDYLKNTKNGINLCSDQSFRFSYLFNAIQKNISFANHLIDSNFYDINAIQKITIHNFQVEETFLSATHQLLAKNSTLYYYIPKQHDPKEKKQPLCIAVTNNPIVAYLNEKKAKTTAEVRQTNLSTTSYSKSFVSYFS